MSSYSQYLIQFNSSKQIKNFIMENEHGFNKSIEHEVSCGTLFTSMSSTYTPSTTTSTYWGVSLI